MFYQLGALPASVPPNVPPCSTMRQHNVCSHSLFLRKHWLNMFLFHLPFFFFTSLNFTFLERHRHLLGSSITHTSADLFKCENGSAHFAQIAKEKMCDFVGHVSKTKWIKSPRNQNLLLTDDLQRQQGETEYRDSSLPLWICEGWIRDIYHLLFQLLDSSYLTFCFFSLTVFLAAFPCVQNSVE